MVGGLRLCPWPHLARRSSQSSFNISSSSPASLSYSFSFLSKNTLMPVADSKQDDSSHDSSREERDKDKDRGDRNKQKASSGKSTSLSSLTTIPTVCPRLSLQKPKTFPMFPANFLGSAPAQQVHLAPSPMQSSNQVKQKRFAPGS